jgi:hypothetical protein
MKQYTESLEQGLVITRTIGGATEELVSDTVMIEDVEEDLTEVRSSMSATDLLKGQKSFPRFEIFIGPVNGDSFKLVIATEKEYTHKRIISTASP